MLRVSLLFFCAVACRSHAVLPVVVPAVHHTSVALPYGVHGFAGHEFAGHGFAAHGFAGHGLLHHGWASKPVHHLLKRSPHVVPLDHGAHLGTLDHGAHLGTLDHGAHLGTLDHGAHFGSHLGAVAPVEHFAPIATSHHSRVDVHSSPAVAVAPVVPVVKSVAVPLFHKSFLAAPYHYGVGHYGHHVSPHHFH